jgi:serine/threonine protein kinase
MKTVRKKRLLNTITRKNIIGKGREGTVYNAVNSNGTHYALKEGPLGKQEVEFAETVAAKYPDHFMQLYDHREGVAVWSKVDTTLKEFHGSKKDIYVQIFKILTILEKEGWTHNDFHPSNIGIVDGTKVKIIDYGLVRKGFQPGRDIYKLFSIVKQNGIDTDLYRVKKRKLEKVTMSLLKPYLPPVSKFMQMDLEVLLLDLLAPKEFKRLYPGLEVPHVLSKLVMLYIIKHIEKPEACLQYMLKRDH